MVWREKVTFSVWPLWMLGGAVLHVGGGNVGGENRGRGILSPGMILSL